LHLIKVKLFRYIIWIILRLKAFESKGFQQLEIIIDLNMNSVEVPSKPNLSGDTYVKAFYYSRKWDAIFELSRHIKRFSLIVLTILAFAANIYGQSNGDYQTNATGAWNWSTVANWQVYSAGTWGAASDYPGQNPGAGIVTIQNNTVITLDISPANAIGFLTITGGINASSINLNGFTLTITGAASIAAPTAAVTNEIIGYWNA
jgi:hypothetical protein